MDELQIQLPHLLAPNLLVQNLQEREPQPQALNLQERERAPQPRALNLQERELPEQLQVQQIWDEEVARTHKLAGQAGTGRSHKKTCSC